MAEKDFLIEICGQILERPNVQAWYEEELTGKSQAHTIESVEKGIREGRLTVNEGLAIVFITGLQWTTKFEGTP